MDINEFREGFRTTLPMDSKEMSKIIMASLMRCSLDIKNMVIMEELAELAQQVSKMARNEGDRLALLEEMADVFICLHFLLVIGGFTDDDFQRAITVKLIREKERCEKE